MHKLPMNVFKFHYDLKFAFRDFQILQIPFWQHRIVNPQADHSMWS